MRLRIVLIPVVVAALSGCSMHVAVPPEPTATDFAELSQLRLDAVWDGTGLTDDIRPEVTRGETLDQTEASKVFTLCMKDRGWPGYDVDGNGWSYRDLGDTSDDRERLDWYECYAAHSIDDLVGLRSAAQYDFIYDYFQQILIPCLADHGYEVEHAPTRVEFQASANGYFSNPFWPLTWNPYYELPGYAGVGTLSVAEQCPAEPPEQDFYVLT